MGVRFYDDALLAKLKRWTNGSQVTITGVNETRRLFEVMLDKQNDKELKLPIIALSRPAGYSVLIKQKRPASHNGSTAVATRERSAKLNIVPIAITYQLDIYTRYFEEADEYARNFIFNIINYPKLNIEIPYEDQKLTADANIRITTDVEDNSDIPERLISGQFTRITLGLNIDDAYLFDVRIKDNISINPISVEAISATD